MRVAFDDQIFRAQTRGGVSRYIVELVAGLPHNDVSPILSLGSTRNRHAVDAGLARERVTSSLRERAEWVSWRAMGRPRTPVVRDNHDLIHHTFTHPAYLRDSDAPSVVTIHDMTPELMPEKFPLGNPHFAKRRYAESASHIITVSQSTADDMFRLYGDHLRAKTTVVPLGVAEHFFNPSVEPVTVPADYGLFVGVRGGYKRFDLAVDVMKVVMQEEPHLHFVVVGGGEFSASERSQLQAAGIADRTVRLVPTDRQLAAIYRRARFFLFPSEYEGFGLPTLEALASGTPTILADASCSREIGGSAVTYFTPGDVDEAIALSRHALTESVARAAEVDGPHRARMFTWAETARRTADVYRDVKATSR